MTVTRHLALWAACVSVSTAQHYDDTRDGLWHVCSPAWAAPQLDDDSWAEAHPAAAANISANARAHVLRVLGASVASERRVVMAVLRGYRQALACAQPA
jgi:hypothetical protein